MPEQKAPASSQVTSSVISAASEAKVEFPAGATAFRHSDGLPVKLSVKSTAAIRATCRHGAEHVFHVPVSPTIEWSIEGKKRRIEAGAFKVGHMEGAEYMTRDSGECVIYHPPPSAADLASGQEMRVLINLIITPAESHRAMQELAIDMSREHGLGKGTSSSARVSIITSKPAAQEHGSLLLPPETGAQDACKECNLRILPESVKRTIISSRAQDGKHLMASEYVKFEAPGAGRVWILDSRKEMHPVRGLSPACDLDWACSAGEFVGRCRGESVVYLAPDESQLSKSSPLTIMLSSRGAVHDARKFWLLRRPSGMHC